MTRPTLSSILKEDIPLTMKGMPAPERQRLVRETQSKIKHVSGGLTLIHALMVFHEQMESIPEWSALRIEMDSGLDTIGLSLHWFPEGSAEDEGEWLSLDNGEESFVRDAGLYGMKIDAKTVSHIFEASHEITWLVADPEAKAVLEQLGPCDFHRPEVANPAPLVFSGHADAIRAWEASVDMAVSLPEASAAPRPCSRP